VLAVPAFDAHEQWHGGILLHERVQGKSAFLDQADTAASALRS
jgi:hypothetical protein